MPAPYYYERTSDTTLTIDFEGDHVVLAPGARYTLPDACSILRFINAVHAQEGSGVTDATPEGIDAVQQECIAAGGTGTGTVPSPLPPTPDPSATDSNNPQPHGAENAQGLGAPDPQPNGNVSGDARQPGQSDGRPLAQQYYDKNNPMPDYDVNDQLQQQGVPPDKIEDAFKKILHNDAPDGLAHPEFGKDDRLNPSVTGADPVNLFTGQFTLRVTDLQIPSRGMPLHVTRIYRSGAVSFGPWGYNWDHNYNVYLRPLADGSVAIWTGEINEDVYSVSPNGFEPPVGVFRNLVHEPANMNPERWILTDREGMTFVFARPTVWPVTDRFPLVRIKDRHDNAHVLTYDDQGRLQQVKDHAGRFFQFGYGDCGLLENIVDHTGRSWQYVHDAEVEHLISAISPATPEYPEGVATTYEYDTFQGHPALRHNILRVIDGNGRVIVRNEYDIDPVSDDFARVVYQEFGDFEATLSARQLQYVPRLPDALNVPAVQVESIDPGVLRVYIFNYRGDLLDERMRLVYDGTYRLWARVYRYDDQGNLAERHDPNGLGMLYTWDTTNPDPRARGNLTKAELVPSPLFADPSRIMQIYTYEPAFHRPKTLRDEAGFVTTWVYDYEELAGTVGDVIRIEYPNVTLPDGSTQSRQERFAYNLFGQMTEHDTATGVRHIFSYYDSGVSDGYMQSITWDAGGAAEVQSLEYDAQGHRSAFIDGLGNRIETDTNALDLTTAVRLPVVNGEVAEARFFHTPDGLVRREELPRGTYTDPVIADTFLAHEYEYDVFGNLVQATYGVNTIAPRTYEYKRDGEGHIVEMRDALGRLTSLRYDERGRVLTRTEAAGLSEEASWQFFYDVNGNQTSVMDPAGHRLDYIYDAWDRLVVTTLHGAPDAERTRIQLTLNRFDKTTRVLITGRMAPGVTGNLLQLDADYDERGRCWRRKLDARVTTLTWDADDRTIRQKDQRGNELKLTFDGLNRVTRSEDAVGNFELRNYDPAGNLVTVESHEVVPGGGMEVFTTTFDYDQRGQPFRITRPLGLVSETIFDARGYAVHEIDPLGRTLDRSFGLLGELLSVTEMESPGQPLTHAFSFDVSGRQIASTDPMGRTTAYAFDARDRRTSITYPDGRVHTFFYNQRQQPASETTPGGTVKTYTYGPDAGLRQIDFTPGVGVAPTPSLQLVPDGLRRVVQIQQAGLILHRSFDSSLRLISETVNGKSTAMAYDDNAGTADLSYSDGRLDRLTFDQLGRLESIAFQQAGAAALVTGVAPGTKLAKYTWQGVDRIARRDLHTALTTQMDYDAAGRLVAIRHLNAGNSALAEMRYVYDAAGRHRIVWSQPLPNQPARFDFDGLSRLRTAALDVPIAEPAWPMDQAQSDVVIATAEAAPVTLAEKYQIDGGDARIETKLFASNDTLILTPGCQITQLVRTGAGAGVFPFTFDGDGRCTQDDRHRYIWNAMDQLVEVQTLLGIVISTQIFDPAGRVIGRTENGETYAQTSIGNRVLERQSVAGDSLLQFTYGTGIDELLMESSGSNRYPLQDASSSVLAYADQGVAVSERYHYSPFGEAQIWTPDGSVQLPASVIGGLPRFGGHVLLNSGLYDARARVYDPRTGRFLQPDPLGYINSDCLYTYAHHNPVDFVDPTGEVALLIGLVVAAGVGLIVGGASNAIRQGIQIHEGSRSEFSWGELGLSAGAGMVMGPILVVAPELGLPLAAYGVYQGGSEIAAGHYETGAFDITTSLLPFAFKGVRSSTFGKGSLFAPWRGLGPSATAAERFGHFPTLGRATTDVAGRMWNQRLYHGTTMQSAQSAAKNIQAHLKMVRFLQQFPGTRHLGEGLYFGRVPGDPTVPGTPMWWAQQGGSTGRGGGNPGLLEASIPRWRFFLLSREPGVLVDVPQVNFNHPDARQTFFPFEGPRSQVAGPAAHLGDLARWRVVDPNAVQPSLDGLWPSLLAKPPRWPDPPTGRRASK
jgi:RHS repeat-associated protein